MSQYLRIIPRLDIKNMNLVKGVNLEGLRRLGKASVFSEHYSSNQADEIIYHDVTATLYQKNGLRDLIRSLSKKTFIPLTVGGGIRNLEDIQTTIASGADRIAINSEALQRPGFLKDAVRHFGSSSIVSSIEVVDVGNQHYKICTDNGRIHSERKLLDWIDQVQDLGTSEILLTSVDAEGTMSGPDLKLLETIAGRVKVPLLLHGGIASAKDVRSAINVIELSGVVVSSLFHYSSFNQINDSSCNTMAQHSLPKHQHASIIDFKMNLIQLGIPCRPNLSENVYENSYC